MILPTEPYNMSLVGSDAELVQRMVNQGIDSHLEACYIPSRGDSFEPNGHRLDCLVSVESMAVLMRRLDEDGSEEAYDFLSAIESTLEDDE